jgi:tetratricopeptide (TPR) repeat protein
MNYLIICLFALLPFLAIAQQPAQKPADGRPSEQDIMLEKLFIEATREKILGKKQDALTRYQEVLQKDPKNHMASYEIAVLSYELNQFQQAYTHAENAVNLDKKSVLYVDFFSKLLDKKGEQAKAAALYAKLIESDPEDKTLYFKCAEVWTNAGDRESAIKVYNNLEKKTGINPEIFGLKYRLYLETGKEKKGVQELQQLIEKFPNESGYILLLANYYKKNGKTEEASKYYDKVLKNDPTNASANIEMLDIFRVNGDTSRYLSALKSFFEDAQQSSDSKLKALNPLLNDVLASKAQKYSDQILELSQSLARIEPENPAVYMPLGKLLLYKSRYAEAVAAFESFTKWDKSKIEPWLLLLESTAKAGKGDILLEKSQQFADLYPDQATSQYYRGFALLRCGDFKAAQKMLKRAADMSLSDDQLHARCKSALGEAYKALGDSKADAAFNDAKKSADMNVQFHLASSMLRNKETKSAEEIITKLCASDPKNLSYKSLEAKLLCNKSTYTEAKQLTERIMNEGALNDPYVLELYGDIHYWLNDQEAALLHWKQALEKGCNTDKLKLKIENKKPD